MTTTTQRFTGSPSRRVTHGVLGSTLNGYFRGLYFGRATGEQWLGDTGPNPNQGFFEGNYFRGDVDGNFNDGATQRYSGTASSTVTQRY